MLRNREGFTLIELLIVVVIIGILAAIALPKFGETRERAYVSAMESDLRNLQTAQEMYYSDDNNDYTYWTGTLAPETPEPALGFQASSGVTIDVANPPSGDPSLGFTATASHAALESTQICEITVGGSGSQAISCDI